MTVPHEWTVVLLVATLFAAGGLATVAVPAGADHVPGECTVNITYEDTNGKTLDSESLAGDQLEYDIRYTDPSPAVSSPSRRLPVTTFSYQSRIHGGGVNGITSGDPPVEFHMDEEDGAVIVSSFVRSLDNNRSLYSDPSIVSIDQCGDEDLIVSRGTKRPPNARFSISPENPRPGEEVTFSAADSTDPDGDLSGFSWDINESIRGPEESGTPRVTFSETGAHNFQLFATDKAGLGDAVAQRVVVSQGQICNRHVEIDFSDRLRDSDVDLEVTNTTTTVVPRNPETDGSLAERSDFHPRSSPASIFGAFKRGEPHVLSVEYPDGTVAKKRFVPCDTQSVSINRSLTADRDILEPNDDRANATKVSVEQVVGNRPAAFEQSPTRVGPDNPDYYWFDPEKDGEITASATHTQDGAELDLALLGPEGELLKQATRETFGGNGKELQTRESFLIDTPAVDLGAGTHYLRVSSDTPGLTYNLTATRTREGKTSARLDTVDRSTTVQSGQNGTITVVADAPRGLTEHEYTVTLDDTDTARFTAATVTGDPASQSVTVTNASVEVEAGYDDPRMEDDNTTVARLAVEGLDDGTATVDITDGGMTTQTRAAYEVVEGISPAGEPSDVTVRVDGGGVPTRDALGLSVSPDPVTAGAGASVLATVTDESGTPVDGATVEVPTLGVSVTTGAAGEATLPLSGPDPGSYEVVASADGFADANTTLTVERTTGNATGLPTEPGEPGFSDVLAVIQAFNGNAEYADTGVSPGFGDVLAVIQAFNDG